MIGILLITHNGLGDSLVDCVRHVMGDVPLNLRVLSILADDDPQRKEKEGRELMVQLDTGEGVLMLSDLIGATPCNIGRRLFQPGRTVGVAGVNLPMLLRAVCYRHKPLAEVAQKALEGGRECIVLMDTDEGCHVESRCTNH
ncbi:PTS mannose transporter subunit IIA [Candidatus Nitrotoga sp. HW29]|uniref:PTS sugar transporter subunit IIA n=1 Tax=Candidatus Nitrotoga sp. HW29 TaxID=2886963 RepID=UPI001EF1ED78|nr:PTS fructose transporter subunit IIA [Candidatus Nitrotoga sp. HW29]CAH1903980.1 PTS mannose transporter subunit IIA [Candidatus Nitrotoga sp. HW29]